ncbi:MAG: ribosome maturation factor [Chitinophagaceae bacterium]|nr:ribosome maturation factor [Chitinophagaceae bacterium]
MDQEKSVSEISGFVNRFIEKWPEVFVLETTISATNKVTVLLDADNGMNIERCAEVNRALYRFVEEKQLFGQKNFSMEVSSPGIDRPLTEKRQYKKNTGRNIQVVLEDGSRLTGKLTEVKEEEVIVEKEDKKKKKQSEKELVTIPFKDIRQTKVLVTF